MFIAIPNMTLRTFGHIFFHFLCHITVVSSTKTIVGCMIGYLLSIMQCLVTTFITRYDENVCDVTTYSAEFSFCESSQTNQILSDVRMSVDV